MKLFTLGPDKTNCQAAAYHYLKAKNILGEVKLFNTLEEATEKITNEDNSHLLSCIAYPDLHKIVFRNLSKLRLVDSLIFNTIPMVLACNKNSNRDTIITHPAPIDLINKKEFKIIELANSNSNAAVECSKGRYDCCITTLTAAKKHNLKIIENFGEIPMGFALHKAI